MTEGEQRRSEEPGHPGDASREIWTGTDTTSEVTSETKGITARVEALSTQVRNLREQLVEERDHRRGLEEDLEEEREQHRPLEEENIASLGHT